MGTGLGEDSGIGPGEAPVYGKNTTGLFRLVGRTY